MVPYLGDFAEDQSVFVAFNTFDSNDPSASATITNLADTDIHIHKNDGTTQHSSAADVDVQIDFDTVTGNHMVEIRTTDVFFTTGADYFVRMEGTTVDGGTVNAWIAHFSIENRFTNVTKVSGTIQTANDNGVDINAILVDTNALNDTKIPDTLSLANINAEVDTAIETYGLQYVLSTALPTNWSTDVTANSAIDYLADDGTTVFDRTTDSLQAIADSGGGGPTAAQIADAVWDEATAGHTTGGTFGEQCKTDVDAILADTNELQTDDTPTAIAAVQTTADAIEVDTQDIQSRLPAALVSGRMSSDAVALSGSTAAADNLEASAEVIVVGTAQTGTLSTTQMSTNLTEATDDHYIGRSIIWTGGVLLGQATDITDYAGTNGVLTFTAVTEAPSNGDTFVIV